MPELRVYAKAHWLSLYRKRSQVGLRITHSLGGSIHNTIITLEGRGKPAWHPPTRGCGYPHRGYG